MSERVLFTSEFRSGLINGCVEWEPEGRVIGAAFSLGTFFVAVDKESTSPAGATARYQQLVKMGKGETWIPAKGTPE